ncbi:MAG TPA: NUMOD1 domain-containing DNA-binding protein [Burkholderiales bacterium]|mgnify:CR=1 FL=1|nr:NUMOD1 domain-containing DNA-binding protein [Burkholderiales bacterium]
MSDKIYQELKAKYHKSAISKRELAEELGCSESTINYYISKGINLPNYKKLQGKGNGGKVIFPLHEVAVFLSKNLQIGEKIDSNFSNKL